MNWLVVYDLIVHVRRYFLFCPLQIRKKKKHDNKLYIRCWRPPAVGGLCGRSGELRIGARVAAKVVELLRLHMSGYPSIDEFSNDDLLTLYLYVREQQLLTQAEACQLKQPNNNNTSPPENNTTPHDVRQSTTTATCGGAATDSGSCSIGSSSGGSGSGTSGRGASGSSSSNGTSGSTIRSGSSSGVCIERNSSALLTAVTTVSSCPGASLASIASSDSTPPITTASHTTTTSATDSGTTTGGSSGSTTTAPDASAVSGMMCEGWKSGADVERFARDDTKRMQKDGVDRRLSGGLLFVLDFIKYCIRGTRPVDEVSVLHELSKLHCDKEQPITAPTAELFYLFVLKRHTTGWFANTILSYEC
eukprot:GHVS01031693.1.p1 GENE.GHVS01031693.1~~GHVS01031693.1.p1  ORF type:complete len:362 (-),score=106.12 GHVS01031693.1:136-1221(-)